LSEVQSVGFLNSRDICFGKLTHNFWYYNIVALDRRFWSFSVQSPKSWQKQSTWIITWRKSPFTAPTIGVRILRSTLHNNNS
jgi:hypothetical protein